MWVGVAGPLRRSTAAVVAILCTLCVMGVPSAGAAGGTFGEEGEGAGQFNVGVSVAVDNCSNGLVACTPIEDPSVGDVYVADRNNNRIDKFGPNGEFLLAWGWGVNAKEPKAELQTCTEATGCQTGVRGSGAGQFNGPNGVAVDSDVLSLSHGDVYVEDSHNLRVDKFSEDGRFLLAWGWGVANGAQEAQQCGPEALSPTTTCQAAPEVENHAAGEFDRLEERAIAVDSEGTVYVGDVGRVQEFGEGGVFARQVTLTGDGFIQALAVNEAKDVYVMSGGGSASEEGGVHEYKPCSVLSCTGEELGKPRDPAADGEETGIALGSSGALFVDTGGRVGEFEAAGEHQLASFPSAAPLRGLAFGDGVGELYVLTSNEVQVLSEPPPGPDVESGEAIAEPAGKAALTATFDPEGQTEDRSEESHFFFEYGKTASYEASTPVEPSTGGNFESRTVPAQQLKGLEPSREYHFRVVVRNAEGKTTNGNDQTFTTLPALSIETESASEVFATSAQLDADINPLGSQTAYHFEYLTEAEFVANGDGWVGPNKPVAVPQAGASAGSGDAPVAVDVQLSDLSPATTYDYRVVAEDPLSEGMIVGADHTFTTRTTSSPGLIDGRAWGMVSPPDKHGASLEMSVHEGGLLQAAKDGGRITYIAEAPITSHPAGARSFAYSQLLSTRGPAGWSTEDITTPQESVQNLVGGQLTEYKMFSSDLSSALVEPQGATPLCPNAKQGECPERTPYVRQSATGEYAPLVTPDNVLDGVHYGGRELPQAEPEVPAGGAGFEEGTQFVDATPDLSHIVLDAPLVLTSGFKEGFTPEAKAWSLYEWSASALKLVSILPNEHPAAEEGLASQLGNANHGVRNAISSDGGRVVFESYGITNATSDHLYMRDLSLEKTVQLDVVQAGVVNPGNEKPIFVDATSDDSRIFFLDTQRLTENSTAGNELPDLYMCEIAVVAGNPTCTLKDLSVPLHAGENANVAGPDLGIDETGAYVYFVAAGVLAEGAVAGSPNLYVEDTLTEKPKPQLVAVLSPADQPDWRQRGPELLNEFEGMTSRVSANGRFLAFMSQQSLTGYDNEDVTSQAPGERMDEEVFLYHAPEPELLTAGEPGTLTCVSCDPTGARPHGVLDPADAGEHGTELALLVDGPGLWAGSWLAGSLPGWPRLEPEYAFYQPRNLDDDGRLFFDSADALVPQDVNGKEDVYEYEPQIPGKCALPSGCVGLISSGTSSEEAAFIDAGGMGPGGEEGEDVFFMTAAKLVPQDTDSALDVYDAHVCSAVAPCPSQAVNVPHACTTADSCRAAPAPQPDIFGVPASATVGGPGNLAPAPPAKPKPRPLTRAQKLARALKACRGKKGKKRKTCEKAARKKYGSRAGKSSDDRRAK